jgi:peptidoglycan/LPS O-acetylase OafA/YrhL
MEKHRTVGTTDTLKGLAISAVLVNHYLNLNVTGDFAGYAYLIVVIFFILSGYGLRISLAERCANCVGGSLSKEILGFYGQRLVRIFPLLWCAWIIQLLVQGGDLSPWTLLGIHGTGHYWFIPALLQCYLLAPAVFLGAEKHPRLLVGILALALGVVNFVLFRSQTPDVIKKIADFTNSCWGGVYFLHILFFASGFLIPHLLTMRVRAVLDAAARSLADLLFWLFAAATLLLMLILKRRAGTGYLLDVALEVASLTAISALCAYALGLMIEYRILSFLGEISYPIYLFHMSYYLLLDKIGGFPQNSVAELAWSVASFPLFILACLAFERLGRYFSTKFRSSALPGVA